MRVLLDNCVPVKLATHIRGHEVSTAVEMGWTALDDGPLLDAMAGHFDVLITVDKSLRFQQLMANRPVAVVVLRAQRNRVDELARLIPALGRALIDVAPGEFREIGSKVPEIACSRDLTREAAPEVRRLLDWYMDGNPLRAVKTPALRATALRPGTQGERISQNADGST